MAKPHGSVRIGPISLFTLIIVLCLAVLTVLSVTTSLAELSTTERQAATTTETYQLETAGQQFVADVDAALAEGGDALSKVLVDYGIQVQSSSTGGSEELVIEDDTVTGEPVGGDLGRPSATEAVDGSPVTFSGTRDGELISATFSMESGRTLAIVLRIQNDTYTIEQWKVTTEWTDDGTGENLSVLPTTGFTEVTSDLYYQGGYLATLKIPSIDVNVKVYEGTGSSVLRKGAGHFEDTSIWAGNICVAAHNRGVNAHFGEIHTLDVGDEIILTTKLGKRTYAVTSVNKISEMENSLLAPTAENCITLFTCVRNQSAYRWAVRAVEVP